MAAKSPHRMVKSVKVEARGFRVSGEFDPTGKRPDFEAELRAGFVVRVWELDEGLGVVVHDPGTRHETRLRLPSPKSDPEAFARLPDYLDAVALLVGWNRSALRRFTPPGAKRQHHWRGSDREQSLVDDAKRLGWDQARIEHGYSERQWRRLVGSKRDYARNLV